MRPPEGLARAAVQTSKASEAGDTYETLTAPQGRSARAIRHLTPAWVGGYNHRPIPFNFSTSEAYMPPDNAVNYESVLVDLKAKRDKLDIAISAIEEMLGGASPANAPANSQSEEVKPDSFFSMSIPDAARKFLAMSKKPRSTTEICEALENGGLTHSSANFANTVGSVLNRVDSSGGDIVKVSRGSWGLPEWYPGRKRGKQEKKEQESQVPVV